MGKKIRQKEKLENRVEREWWRRTGRENREKEVTERKTNRKNKKTEKGKLWFKKKALFPGKAIYLCDFFSTPCIILYADMREVSLAGTSPKNICPRLETALRIAQLVSQD